MCLCKGGKGQHFHFLSRTELCEGDSKWMSKLGLNNLRTQTTVDSLMQSTEINEEASNFIVTQQRDGPEKFNVPKSGSEDGV